MDTKLSGIVVTQICAHIVSTPPLVVADSRIVRAVNTGAQAETVGVICDGVLRKTLKKGEAAQVTRSDSSVPLIHFNNAEQLQSIDRKLKGR